MSNIPWDALKRDTIRALINDFGLAPYTKHVRNREKLIQLLRDIETDGREVVVQRLQEQADRERARQGSPEVEYAGPSSPVFSMHPVVEIPLRAGPSRVRANTSSPSASAPSAAKKRRVPPPSYAVLYQLEQEISAPSADPIPLMHPNRTFEGVFLPPPPRRTRLVPAEDEEVPESVSAARGVRAQGGLAGGSRAVMRLEAVEMTRPVDAVKRQWRQGASSG